MADSPFYPIGGIKGWLFRQLFGGSQQAAAFNQSFILNKNQPIWIDMENLLGVYLTVPHLRAIIDKKAEMFSNAELYVVDKDGNRVDNPDVEKLLRNPNPLQNQQNYMYQWLVYYEVFAQCFEYKMKPEISFSPLPRVMWNLPPSNIAVKPTGKIWDQTTLDGIIAGYEMQHAEDGSVIRNFLPSQIIHTTQGVSNKYIVGESKLNTLQKPLSNIVGALRTRNCIIFDRGALGIISSESKDSVGGIPLGDKEKKALEAQLRRDYGIQDDQMRTLITAASLKYTPMTYPTKDLMLFEEIEDDVNAICAAFGMARDLFPSTKGATYENMKEAERGTYQNTLQPLLDLWCMSRTQDPDISKGLKDGQSIEGSYEYLAVMKNDELKEHQAEQAEQAAIGIEIDNIMKLNTAVAQGTMSRDAAVMFLVSSCEYEQNEAESLISATPKAAPTTTE